MSSSIHIQKASGGAITHNSRENYSKSVVFKDEKNELWNDKKEAYEIYRTEINKRIEAYTNRTNQKLQKTAVTQLSAVVNLEQHHTLKDLEKIKEELEKVFDTKVYQMAIHRDEGKLKHKETNEYLVSGIDFFYNEKDGKYYSNKTVEKKQHIFTNEININEYQIEKNYHAHIEMMGLDSQGNAIRQKMNRYVLSKLQDFTAETLQMERGKNYQNERSSKRLDTHEYKTMKKVENEIEKDSKKRLKNQQNQMQKQVDSYVEKQKNIKEKLKEEIASLRAELKESGATRGDYAKLEALNKGLQVELKNKKLDNEKLEKAIEILRREVLGKDENIKYLQSDFQKEMRLKERILEEKEKMIDSQMQKINTLLGEIEDLKIDVYHPTFETVSGQPIKNVDAVNYLVPQIETLEIANKDLQEKNSILESKVITLEEKSIPTQTMSDYEAIKKENESLKIENESLKMKVSRILEKANAKIKELFKFKIYNDVIFRGLDDHLVLDDWEDRCRDREALDKRYMKEIEIELIAADEKKELENIFESRLKNLNKQPEKIQEKKVEFTRDVVLQR